MGDLLLLRRSVINWCSSSTLLRLTSPVPDSVSHTHARVTSRLIFFFFCFHYTTTTTTSGDHEWIMILYKIPQSFHVGAAITREGSPGSTSLLRQFTSASVVAATAAAYIFALLYHPSGMLLPLLRGQFGMETQSLLLFEFLEFFRCCCLLNSLGSLLFFTFLEEF